MQVDAYKAFCLHRTIGMYFTRENFGISRVGSRIMPPEKFDKMKGRYQYFQVAKKYKRTLEEFFVSVCVGDIPHKWVGDLVDDKYHTQFMEYTKRHEALSRTFQDDVSIIVDFMDEKGLQFRDLLTKDGEQMPMIARLQDQDFISLETATLIHRFTGFATKCDCLDPDWTGKRLLLMKYDNFITVNEPRRFMSMLRNSVDAK